jgi:uncharacterized protein YndB with AHSA1/START domain
MDTTDRPMGTVLNDEGRLGVRYERHLAHPPEKVWRALTESEHLAHWMPADIVGERRAGASIELPFWPSHVERYDIETPTLPGEILVWDPPNVFSWTWDVDVLRWELAPTEGGTLLTFTTWFGDGEAATAWGAAAGYHVCLDQLADVLDGRAVGTLIDRDMGDWEQRYRDAVHTVAGSS